MLGHTHGVPAAWAFSPGLGAINLVAIWTPEFHVLYTSLTDLSGLSLAGTIQQETSLASRVSLSMSDLCAG
jgi:hypothetical protein